MAHPGAQHDCADEPLLSHLSTVLASCLPEGAPVAVAVSGGADSMALALLLHALGHAPTALTVDHGLRPESAAEAAQVAAWMHTHGIAHHILTPAPLVHIPNIQTRAREMRYGALGGWCRAHGHGSLLLAHHADDQAETLALQQHRGESPPSRSGMALLRMRGGVRMVRPLLGVRKARLVSYLRSRGQAWVDDPSNRNAAFARTRVRHALTDADRLILWQEARAQGAKRHGDDETRNRWVRRHVHAAGDGLTFALCEWRALEADDGTDLLSRAVQAVGGKPYRPRLTESVRLAFTLRTEESGKATLGHAVTRWRDGHVHITPEHRHKGVEAGMAAPHIPPPEPLKLLASEPFWWFNFDPLL